MRRRIRRAAIASAFLTCLFAVVALTRLGTASLTIAEVTITGSDTVMYNQLTSNGNDVIAIEIFNKMVDSTETFSFTSLASAQSHFQLREQIVSVMNSMKAGPGGINFDFYGAGGIKYPGVGMFVPVDPKATQPTIYFKVYLSGVKTSVAVQSIEWGQTRNECKTAAICAFLIAHRRVYGDAWLDGQIPAGTLAIGPTRFFRTPSADQTKYIPGDLMYMKNIDDYDEMAKEHGTQIRLWAGENAVYNGGGKYTGLGCYNLDEIDLREQLRQGYFRDTGISPSPADVLSGIKFVRFDRVVIQP
jgi:hypothetical protein